MFCSKCGKTLNENSAFCPDCGTEIISDNANKAETTVLASEQKSINQNPTKETPYQAQSVPSNGYVAQNPTPAPQINNAQPQYAQQPQYAPSAPYSPQYSYGGEYIPLHLRPLSAWAYFGYQILFLIPVIGFICLIIFACGGTSNVNLKNYARSFFCILVILAILIGALVAIGGFSFL